MTSYEPQSPLSIQERINAFRNAGYMRNLSTEFSEQEVIDSYLSTGANNSDFARLYGRIVELLSQITEDTLFLEHLSGEAADNLLGMMHQLQNDVSITLEGAIDEISRFASTSDELAEYISVIPSANLDEIAQLTLQGTEIIQMFQSEDEDSQVLHEKLNQNLISKLERIRERLTQVEDLARLLEMLIRKV